MHVKSIYLGIVKVCSSPLTAAKVVIKEGIL